MLNNTTINFNRHPSINLWAVLDWLFPPFCVNCQKIGYEICPACWDSIERLTPSHTCPICGKANLHGNICAECRKQTPTFDQLKSWARYQGAARNIVTGIKYQRRLGLVPLLTPALAEAIRAWGIHADLMTPVPLGKKRLRERGYNQADLIAKPVAKTLALPYSPNALSRIRETRSQVGLNADERHLNMIDAFHAEPEQCRGKTILVVDDISTTGATLNACAAALKHSGAERVYGFTVARTNLFPNSNQMSMEVRV